VTLTISEVEKPQRAVESSSLVHKVTDQTPRTHTQDPVYSEIPDEIVMAILR
jgi:hypothetical protein